jgi:hypothetical protein
LVEDVLKSSLLEDREWDGIIILKWINDIKYGEFIGC